MTKNILLVFNFDGIKRESPWNHFSSCVCRCNRIPQKRCPMPFDILLLGRIWASWSHQGRIAAAKTKLVNFKCRFISELSAFEWICFISDSLFFYAFYHDTKYVWSIIIEENIEVHIYNYIYLHTYTHRHTMGQTQVYSRSGDSCEEKKRNTHMHTHFKVWLGDFFSPLSEFVCLNPWSIIKQNKRKTEVTTRRFHFLC